MLSSGEFSTILTTYQLYSAYLQIISKSIEFFRETMQISFSSITDLNMDEMQSLM